MTAVAGVSGSAFATCVVAMLFDIALGVLEKILHMGAAVSSAQL